MRLRIVSCALFAGLAGPALGLGGELPRLWLLAAGAGALTAVATLASMLLVVQRVVRETRAGADDDPRPTAGDSAVDVAAHEQRLAQVQHRLAEQLKQVSENLGEELRQTLRHEAQSLSEGLRRDLEVGTSPVHRLGRELDDLADDQRRPLAAALEAAGRLGEWIEHLWPVMRAAAGHDVEAIPDHLPDPAAGEWRRSARTLRAFSDSGAATLRRLARGSCGARGNGSTLNSEVAFLEEAGLLTGERPLAERLKRYLEPFDHVGRLGEVTLALQYLVEAYPIEQLSRDQRSRFRRALSKVHRGTDLGEDFHDLVAQVAAGVSLRYRPVRYYKSRTDQSETAFVRQQVSPISLSERVGFEATADKEVIVRLARPFFFQQGSGIYYAGHAHVAR